MSTSKLLDLLREFGIESNEQLESILSSEGNGGSWSNLEDGGNPQSLGFRVVEILSASQQDDNYSNRMYGIQHYTYIGNERIPEQSLKKGLFISRRINFITDLDCQKQTYSDL